MKFGYAGIQSDGALPGKEAERVNWPEKMPDVWRLGGTTKYTVRDGQLRKQKEWKRWCGPPVPRLASRPILCIHLSVRVNALSYGQ